MSLVAITNARTALTTSMTALLAAKAANQADTTAEKAAVQVDLNALANASRETRRTVDTVTLPEANYFLSGVDYGVNTIANYIQALTTGVSVFNPPPSLPA